MNIACLDQKRRAIMKQDPIIAIDTEVFSATNSWATSGISSPYIKKKLINKPRAVMT